MIIPYNLKVRMVNNDPALVFFGLTVEHDLMTRRQHVLHPWHVKPPASDFTGRERGFCRFDDDGLIKLFSTAKPLHLSINDRASKTARPATCLRRKIVKPTPIFIAPRQAIE